MKGDKCRMHLWPLKENQHHRHQGCKILIMMRGLVISIQYEKEDLVQAEKEETDHTKEGETVQQAKNFRRPRDDTSFVPYKRREFRNYRQVPCTDKEFYAIIEQWITDTIVKPLKARPDLLDEDKKNPQYYRYHQ